MRIASTILALAAAAAATPALSADELEAVRVHYKDLDLATKTGRDELDRRLDRAARSVCGLDEAKTGTRLPSEAARRCLADVRARLDGQFAAVIGRQTQG
jgi:UrcA family protein